MLYPTIPGVPLGLHVKSTLCGAAAIPVPLSVSVNGPFVALLMNMIESDAVPEACGENVVVTEMLWPLAMVTGKAMPVIENSELVPEAEETVIAEPLAVNVPVITAFVPTLTLPKL